MFKHKITTFLTLPRPRKWALSGSRTIGGKRVAGKVRSPTLRSRTQPESMLHQGLGRKCALERERKRQNCDKISMDVSPR